MQTQAPCCSPIYVQRQLQLCWPEMVTDEKARKTIAQLLRSLWTVPMSRDRFRMRAGILSGSTCHVGIWHKIWHRVLGQIQHQWSLQHAAWQRFDYTLAHSSLCACPPARLLCSSNMLVNSNKLKPVSYREDMPTNRVWCTVTTIENYDGPIIQNYDGPA